MSSVIKQEVNLYQKQFHPVREVMSLRHCASLLVAVLAVLVLLGGLKFKQLHDREMKIASLEQDHKNLIVELSDIAEQKKKSRDSAVKETDILQRENSLRARRDLLANLMHDGTAAVDGFSEYMVALARQHVQGSWITGLSILEGGEQISISGRVLEPELAPVYLQKMSNEDVFSGKSFGVMELSRSTLINGSKSENPDENHEPIDFILRTSNDDVLTVKEIRNES